MVGYCHGGNVPASHDVGDVGDDDVEDGVDDDEDAGDGVDDDEEDVDDSLHLHYNLTWRQW